MTDFIEIHCTYPEKSQAEQQAKILIEKNIAACVHISEKIQSIYRWQERIEKENEYLLIAKSHQRFFNQIKTEIKLNHPYECPQIYSIAIREIDKAYLQWAIDELNI